MLNTIGAKPPHYEPVIYLTGHPKIRPVRAQPTAVGVGAEWVG